MHYEHEIFLSYPREHRSARWVVEPFLRLFGGYLEDALRVGRVFQDQQNIRTGDSWPPRLKRALSRSRCMVGIWSPKYFESDWCKRECAAFLHREKKLNYRTADEPGGLIIPVTVGDGVHFPDIVQSIQCLDCRNFCLDGDTWIKTESYVRFEECIREWVENSVVPILQNSPTVCKKEWIDKDYIEDPFYLYDLSPKTNFLLPSLE